MGLFLRLGLGALCAAWAPWAAAIVNLEDLHLGTPEPGYSGRVTLGISGDSGNTDIFRVSAGGRLQWRREQTIRYLLADYSYGESNGETDKNSAFVHGRHVEGFAPRWAWEAFAQAERDEFARLSFRGLVGGGLRRALGPSEPMAVFLGAGGFYSREILEQSPGLSEDGAENIWRANLYLVVKRRLSAQTLLVSTTYYQPSVASPEDFRLLEDAGISVQVAENLDLSLTAALRHDSRPPQTVEKTDVSYLTRLSYSF